MTGQQGRWQLAGTAAEEAAAFERKLGLASTREAYPLTYAGQ